MDITTTRRRAPLATVALLLAVAATAVLGAISGVRLVQGVADLRSAPADQLEWTLSQVEVDLLRFRWSVAAAMAEPASPEAIEDVRLRFDLFFSRLSILTDGIAFARLRASPVASAALDELLDFRDDALGLIDGSDAALRAALPELERRIAGHLEVARALTLGGVVVFSAQADADREALAHLLLQTFVTAVVTIVLLVGLVARTLRQSREAERNLLEIAKSRAGLDAVVGASLDAILAIDTKGRLTEFNGAAEKIFGYARDEVLGRPIAEIIVPERLRKAHHDGMARFLATGERHILDRGRAEMEALRRDGSEFPIEISVRSVRVGPELSFVAFVRDITGQRAVARRLEEARDEALAADRAKSRFLALMSHEMRTPLNGMLGTLDLVQRRPLDAEQRKLIETAALSGDILLHHINDVLDMARIEASQDAMAVQDVELRALAGQVVDLNRSVALAKGLALDLQFEGPHLLVRGDPHRLRQIMLNLVGNALKFTDSGSVLLVVAQHEDGAGRARIEIVVADTGPGVPPAQREAVFKEFLTLQAGYDRAKAGTGLGLAITRGIAAALGGTVAIEDAPEGGALFRVRLALPVARTDTDRTGGARTEVAKAPGGWPEEAPRFAIASPPALAPPRPAKPGTAARLDLLLVEDNEINRYVARSMLVAGGHRVTEAHDGAAAVARAAAQRFDLILMDISMPGMDGVEATRRIRALPPPFRDVPIFGLTAHALPQEQRAFEEAGMQKCLIKPIRMATFEAAIASFAAAAAPQAGADTPPMGHRATVAPASPDLARGRRALHWPAPDFKRDPAREQGDL